MIIRYYVNIMLLKLRKLDYLLVWVFFLAFAGQSLRNLTGWVGYGMVVVITVAFLVWVKRKNLRRVLKITPKPVYVWVGTLILSSLFSTYFFTSLLGLFITGLTFITATIVFVSYTWQKIIKSLFFSLILILLLSLVFEFIVACTGSPLLPLFTETPLKSGSSLFYWSTGSLFLGGPVQGIVGNRNLLGFVALLALVLSCVIKNLSVKTRIFAISLVALTIFLTQSATITVAICASAFVAGLVLLIRQIKTKLPRLTYVLVTFIIGSTGTLIVLLYQPLTALLNREPDMTDRFYIWGKVWELIKESPVVGYGWIGYWAPWVEPYNGLIVLGGVEQLHAHNAYLDVFLQTGVIGLLAFIGLLFYVGFYAWKSAVDGKRIFSITSLLLLICLLVQGVAESRLLIEGNLLLLFLLALYVRTHSKLVKFSKESIKDFVL